MPAAECQDQGRVSFACGLRVEDEAGAVRAQQQIAQWARPYPRGIVQCVLARLQNRPQLTL
jgi:hypothetical protein